jgi:WYL_2, Sm-like SH3 beta-barrel fold
MSMEIIYESGPDDLDIDSRNREIRNLLKDGVCEVTFTKINGETRTMPCTLDQTLLPPSNLNEDHQSRAYNPDVISVWCTDKNAWRSFRVANVQKVSRS